MWEIFAHVLPNSQKNVRNVRICKNVNCLYFPGYTILILRILLGAFPTCWGLMFGGDGQIDQRRVDVSAGISNVSCNEMCVSVGLSVGRSVCRRVFYLGVQRFCSETLSSSAFRPTPPVQVHNISIRAKMFIPRSMCSASNASLCLARALRSFTF